MRDAGKAILLVSVELDEIRSLSDRILVMFAGRIVGERRPEATDERELGLLMAGVDGRRRPRDERRRRAKLPRWADSCLIPLINLVARLRRLRPRRAADRREPVRAPASLLDGAFGYGEGIGFTLYYATNFIFTGLAVAVAFHAGLFNIGGEGQAYIAGLGVALVCLALDALPALVPACFPLAIVAAVRVRRGLGAHSRPICRPSAAATSSSPPSCSISSPRR